MPLIRSGASNSTRASALGPVSLSQFIKPSSACSRELTSIIDEREKLKTLVNRMLITRRDVELLHELAEAVPEQASDADAERAEDTGTLLGENPEPA